MLHRLSTALIDGGLLQSGKVCIKNVEDGSIKGGNPRGTPLVLPGTTCILWFHPSTDLQNVAVSEFDIDGRVDD